MSLVTLTVVHDEAEAEMLCGLLRANDIEPTVHLALFRSEDRPGMVGVVGQILGEAGVNIAGMQVSREEKGGMALVALSVDTAIPAEVLDRIREAIDADQVRGVDLSE